MTEVKNHNKLFTRINYWLIGIGTVLIIIGFFCLSCGPVDNPVSLTIAPVLLVLGFCVVVPLALIVGKKD